MCSELRVGNGMRSCRHAGNSPGTPCRNDCTDRGAYSRWDGEIPNVVFVLPPPSKLLIKPQVSTFLSMQTNSDFVSAAAQGAVAVIDGNVMPLNPGEPPHLQMFVWNNLFFSQGFDMSDHYRPLGGNTAAHAAATCDLRGVQVKTWKYMLSSRFTDCLK